MNHEIRETDVVIAGAGPAGMVLGNSHLPY